MSHDDGTVDPLWPGMPSGGGAWMMQGSESWTSAAGRARELLTLSIAFKVHSTPKENIWLILFWVCFPAPLVLFSLE